MLKGMDFYDLSEIFLTDIESNYWIKTIIIKT